MTAAVTDNVAIARVEYWYEDYSVLGSATTAPYTLNWDTTPYSGVHHLRAQDAVLAGARLEVAVVAERVYGDARRQQELGGPDVISHQPHRRS